MTDINTDSTHNVIGRGIEDAEISLKTIKLDSVSEFTHQFLTDTDVFIWWANLHNGDLFDEVALKVKSIREKEWSGYHILFV